MENPKEALTKGANFTFWLKKGTYVKYQYLDPRAKKPLKGGKYSPILKSESSKGHLMLVPLKGGKWMVVGGRRERG